MRAGKVYIVGAGPGDPELLTLKASRLLSEADVVIYDRLVDPNILRFCRDAELIYAGKERGESWRQAEVNRIIAEKALEGKKVVRLKGGDPLIFGRTGEEMLYLSSRGIDLEVVPGVSSVTAAPAAALIPLTLRGLSSSIGITSGSSMGGGVTDIRRLASAADTLIVMMWLTKARELQLQLEGIGLGDKPAAIVSNATTYGQRVVFTDVRSLVDAAGYLDPSSPSLLIIGDVVTVGKTLHSRSVVAVEVW